MQAESIITSESRYYHIRVKKITYLHKQLPKHLLLKLQMGTKVSETTLQLEERERRQQIVRPQWKEEAHIFMYEAEDFLNIYLQNDPTKEDKEHEKEHPDPNGKKEHEQKTVDIAFSRLLLPPLAEYPNTQHTVEVDFIGLHADLSIIRNKDLGKEVPGKPADQAAENIARVQLELYYKLDFSGTLTVVPMSAHLERTVSSIGEMKPVAKFKLLSKKQLNAQDDILMKATSEQAEGGIHPRWAGHFKLKKDKHNLEITNDYSYSFPLTSPGRYLQIDVVSYPIIGFEPDLVGTATVRIDNSSFLKYPRRKGTNLFQTHQIPLTHHIDHETKSVGTLRLEVRFEPDFFPHHDAPLPRKK